MFICLVFISCCRVSGMVVLVMLVIRCLFSWCICMVCVWLFMFIVRCVLFCGLWCKLIVCSVMGLEGGCSVRFISRWFFLVCS